jgi:hypothetical protein
MLRFILYLQRYALHAIYQWDACHPQESRFSLYMPLVKKNWGEHGKHIGGHARSHCEQPCIKWWFDYGFGRDWVIGSSTSNTFDMHIYNTWAVAPQNSGPAQLPGLSPRTSRWGTRTRRRRPTRRRRRAPAPRWSATSCMHQYNGKDRNPQVISIQNT